VFAGTPDRFARFEREARLLAALNHPHIATIHGFHEADGCRFLVLELVEGECLSDRLTRGPIPIGDVLDLALQICDALESAHSRGIVHRDLKPANVRLTEAGDAKVLDFGLAKALWPDGEVAVDLGESPTITSQATVSGVILGTVAYMSPEQARGRRVDKRADIWAFGCLLFEMLTARSPFGGETTTEILVSILGEDPKWERLPASTPPAVRRLLRRCLEKDPSRRLHDIADARLEIEESQRDGQDLSAGQTRAAARRRGWPWLSAAATGAALLLVVGAAAFDRWSGPAAEIPVRMFELALEPSREQLHGPRVAFSPAGLRERRPDCSACRHAAARGTSWCP
jgi:eukaryotic-like serine/threonine-protein kinase